MPVDFAGIPFLEYFNALAVDIDIVFAKLDAGLQVAEYRVVLEKMSECFGIRDVIDGNDIDAFVVHSRAEKIASDPAKTVDAYSNCHSCPWRFRIREHGDVALCPYFGWGQRATSPFSCGSIKSILRRVCISHTR